MCTYLPYRHYKVCSSLVEGSNTCLTSITMWVRALLRVLILLFLSITVQSLVLQIPTRKKYLRNNYTVSDRNPPPHIMVRHEPDEDAIVSNALPLCGRDFCRIVYLKVFYKVSFIYRVWQKYLPHNGKILMAMVSSSS